MSRNRLAWSVSLLAASMMTVACKNTSEPPKQCTVDADCSGNGWCLEGACQTPYGLTLKVDKAAAPDGKTYSNGTLHVSVDVTGGTPPVEIALVDEVRLQLVGAPSYAYDWDTTASKPGSHRVIATAKGGTRTYSSQSVEVIVVDPKAKPPLSVNPVKSPTNQAKVTMTGTGEEKTTVRVFEGTSKLAEVKVLNGGTWSADLDLASMVEGKHDLTVTATGLAGNVSDPVAVTVLVDRGVAVPLTVVNRTPVPGATNVWSRAPITVTFSKPITNPVPDSAVTLAGQGGTAIAKGLSVSSDGLTLTITPANPPTVRNTLQATMNAGVTDLAGNPAVVPSGTWSWELPTWQGLGGTAAVSIQWVYPNADTPALGIGADGNTTVAFVELSGDPATIQGPVVVKQFDNVAWTQLPVPNDFVRKLGPLSQYCRTGASPSVAFNASGQLTVAWSESWDCNSSGGSGSWWFNRMSTWVNGAWQDHPSMPFTSGGGSTLSPVVKFDGTGRPVVAWLQNHQDPTTLAWNKQLFAAVWNGTSWVGFGGVINADPTANVLWSPSLVIDPTGAPVVAWIEMGKSPNVGQFRVKRWNAAMSSWVQVGNVVNLDPTKHASFQSLVLDGDTPVVVWSESTSAGCNSSTLCPQHNVIAARWTGSVWQQMGAALNKDPAQNAVGPVIARSGSGRYVVGWAEITTVRSLILASWDGHAWSFVADSVRDAIPGKISAYLDVVLDSRGIPTVAWAELVPNSQVFVRRFNQ